MYVLYALQIIAFNSDFQSHVLEITETAELALTGRILLTIRLHKNKLKPREMH